jgi:hypothetical protein
MVMYRYFGVTIPERLDAGGNMRASLLYFPLFIIRYDIHVDRIYLQVIIK